MAPASNTNVNGTNECLEQLFHKLLAVADINIDTDTDTQQQQQTQTRQQQQPYLFLVQHTQSFPTRQTATTATKKDEAVYRRAGLRTPAENAKRDFAAGQLWLQYIVNELQQESADILWVQTSSRRLPVWLVQQTTTQTTAVSSAAARSSNSNIIQVIDAAAVDAFGWDNDDDNDEKQQRSSKSGR
jgi:hypothetical protein